MNEKKIKKKVTLKNAELLNAKLYGVFILLAHVLTDKLYHLSLSEQ